MTEERSLMHPDKLKKESEGQLSKWDSIIGLLSLSSIPNNILMWSHYSLNHQGFVVGFDTDSLILDYNFEWIEPINYQEKYPIITGKDGTDIQFYKKFFYKSNLWSYEKEWRISINHIKKRTIKINPESITEIIIGCRSSPKTERQIIKLAKRNFGNAVIIFRAIKLEDKFGIELKQLH